jgi:mycofactocin precursor peptide peptidase
VSPSRPGHGGSTPAALARLRSPAVPDGAVLVVPIGSTEQHGPHLPLGTDTVIAEALAARLADARPDVVVAPALPYGSSGEHAGFPGTLSIGQAGCELLLLELVRSADGFAGTVLVSAHGGNAQPIARAVAVLIGERRAVLAWAPALATWPDADAHAGRVETSLMLALAPGDVALDAAEPGNRRPLAELADALRAGGVRSVSPNGVLGDPGGATADEGERLLERLTADLVSAVEAWRAQIQRGARQERAGRRGAGPPCGPVAASPPTRTEARRDTGDAAT